MGSGQGLIPGWGGGECTGFNSWVWLGRGQGSIPVCGWGEDRVQFLGGVLDRIQPWVGW